MLDYMKTIDKNWLLKHHLDIECGSMAPDSSGANRYEVFYCGKRIYSWWSTSHRLHWYRRRAILRSKNESIENERIFRGL